jgi:hypothetical protein
MSKRGPKPKGKPRRTVIAFGVSQEEKEWLLTLPNRSAWLREQIEKTRQMEHSSTDNSAAVTREDYDNDTLPCLRS